MATATTRSTPCPARDCQRNTCDGCLSDIGHGREPLNQPAALPDRYPDEAPEGPTDLDFSEWRFFRSSPAALPTEPEPYDPLNEDWARFQEFKLESAARELLDRSATLGLAELVDHQARFYRTFPTAAGEMIARAMDELALKIRLVDATTPAEYEARVETLEQDIREQYEAIGFEAGKAACPCQRFADATR